MSLRSPSVALWMAVAAVAGGISAVALDRVLLRSEPVMPAAEASREARRSLVPPPPPTDPGPARAVVVSTLVEAGVPHGAIRHGLYPLRDPGRSPDATVALISFTCPDADTCPDLLERVGERGAAEGFTLVSPTRPDAPGRPLFRALARDGRPSLAIRALPAGARLTLVLDGVGHQPALVDSLLALDPHLTFGVQSNAPHATAVARRLSRAGREVVAHLPMEPAPPDRPDGPDALTTRMDPETLADAMRAQLERVPGAVGADTHQGERLTTSRPHIGAALEVLRERAWFFLDGTANPASVARPAAQALGVRSIARTHALDPEAGDLQAQLKAIEAALVLEGHAVVVAEAEPAVLAALEPWLDDLRRRSIHLLRLSEIVL